MRVRGSAIAHLVSGPHKGSSYSAKMEADQVVATIPPGAGEAPFGLPDEPQQQWIESLALHHGDLIMAGAAIAHGLRAGEDAASWVIKDVLFFSAVSRFIKCFQGSKSRKELKAEAVFAGHSTRMSWFKLFRSLRNKHHIHDENAYDQSQLFVLLNADGAAPAVPTIGVLTQRTDAATIGNMRRLQMLILRTHVWLCDEALRQGDAIAKRTADLTG